MAGILLGANKSVQIWTTNILIFFVATQLTSRIASSLEVFHWHPVELEKIGPRTGLPRFKLRRWCRGTWLWLTGQDRPWTWLSQPDSKLGKVLALRVSDYLAVSASEFDFYCQSSRAADRLTCQLQVNNWARGPLEYSQSGLRSCRCRSPAGERAAASFNGPPAQLEKLGPRRLGPGHAGALNYQVWRRGTRTWSWLTGQDRNVTQLARSRVRENCWHS